MSQGQDACNGPAEDEVLRLRRLAALESVAEVVAERGLAASSVAAVCERASIPRALFKEMFAGLDECFAALVDRTLAQMTTVISEGFEGEASWPTRIVRAMDAMVSFLDSKPAAARACLLGRAAAGPDALESRAAVMESLKLIIDAAREQLPPDSQPPAVMAEATVLSVLGIMRRRVLNDQAPPFAPLLPELVETIVAPYLGPAAAAQASAECRARAAAKRGSARVARATRSRIEVLDMLAHAGARRMRACLLCIASSPGASNAAIGAAIGVTHQGQVSTLLSRLHEAGLLLKRNVGAGLPNAWSLSPFGAEVARALAGDATGRAPSDVERAGSALVRA